MAKVSSAIGELVRDFRPGYRLGKTTSHGTYQVTGPDGKVVRTPDGIPVQVPNGSAHADGNNHGIKKLRSRLTAAGVIARDPTEELVDRIRERKVLTPPPLPEPDPIQQEANEFLGINGNHHLRPAIMVSLEWDEYVALMEAAEMVAAKQTVAKRLSAFLQLAHRAEGLMARKIEVERNIRASTEEFISGRSS